jgi:toxin-antitoxin system PIN domain toxin
LVLPDVNVLIYAFRPEAAAYVEHKRWLYNVANEGTEFGLSPQVLNSLVRILTNPSTFKSAYRMEDVLGFCDDLLASPFHRVIQPGRRHWKIFRDLCLKTGARGNLVQDAWFAALAIEHDCEWITHDTDYGRFPGLRWRSPF